MKRVIKDSILGIVIGQFIGFWMATIFSAVNGASSWLPSSPRWVAQFPSLMVAILAASLLWWAMGILFALGSDFIFSAEEWSITKRTIIHFAVTILGFTPLSCLSGWFPLEPAPILGFILIFIVVYTFIWSINMLHARHTVNQLNQHLNTSTPIEPIN